VKIIEVNLSCPNEGTNNLLCFDIDRSVKVVQSIKEVIGEIPLIVKVAYFKDEGNINFPSPSDENLLKRFVKEIGGVVEGISAINTISAEIVNEKGEQALPGEGRLRSGVCGHSVKWAGLDMVKRLKNLREELGYNYTIIGVGGVMNSDDFFEYLDSGADIVMSATGSMVNPYLGIEVSLELKRRLR
jgi:dihydroorotate dehydrogenase